MGQTPPPPPPVEPSFRIRESGAFYFIEELIGTTWTPISIPSTKYSTAEERLQSVIAQRKKGDTIVARFDANGKSL